MRERGGALEHAMAIGGLAFVALTFLLAPGLHEHNPALPLLIPLLFITLRRGRHAGLAYAAAAVAFDAAWLYRFGVTPGALGPFDGYRLAVFAVVSPTLVVLTSRLREQATQIEARRAAERELQLERDLERARASMSEHEKLATIGAVVNGISHELRTPLTAIANDLAILERRVKATPGAEKTVAAALVDAQENIARLEGLAERLRPYASARGARQRMDLAEAVEQGARLFRVSLPRGHLVELDLEPTGTILADPLSVQQILQELLKNAVEASPLDKPVVVSTRRTPAGAELIVRDEGPGIPEHVRAHVFSEFFTTRPGAGGLGLSIVRRQAEACGATIAFETTASGTTFRVLFPLDIPVMGPSVPHVPAAAARFSPERGARERNAS